MSARYRKRPVTIDAVQYTGKNVAECLEFCDDMATDQTGGTSLLIINTLEGGMRCVPGDYIIKGVAGEFYPCKEHIFHATYMKEPALT